LFEIGAQILGWGVQTVRHAAALIVLVVVILAVARFGVSQQPMVVIEPEPVAFDTNSTPLAIEEWDPL
jgi:hypothetical protein